MVKYYSDGLLGVAQEKNIKPHFTNVLISIRDGVATFKNTVTGQVSEEPYDFIHVVPPMTPPTFLKGSPISNAAGFVDIERTMKHKKYDNVWAIGDCVALPNAKTAAALLSQSPILVHNLELVLSKSQGFAKAKYDGYSSCPLFVGNEKLLLAEFKDYINDEGKPVSEIDETFEKGTQNIPRRMYFWIAYSFTYFYRFALAGKWFGKSFLIRPRYDESGKTKDFRRFYKVGINSMIAVPVITFFWLLIHII
jgi:sulfide:quinone oxidoreductase